MNTRDKSRPDPESPITEAVKAEVLRRRTTYEPDKKTARPWQEIFARLRRKHETGPS